MKIYEKSMKNMNLLIIYPYRNLLRRPPLSKGFTISYQIINIALDEVLIIINIKYFNLYKHVIIIHNISLLMWRKK